MSAVTITVTGLPVVSIPVTLVISPPLPTLALSSPTHNSEHDAVCNLGANRSRSPPTALRFPSLLPPAQNGSRLRRRWAWFCPAAQTSLTITVDTTTLNPQVIPYTAKVTLALSGASVKAQNITVNVTVNSAAPTITSVWPTQLPLNGVAQTITIEGTNFYTATVAMIQGRLHALGYHDLQGQFHCVAGRGSSKPANRGREL